MELHHSEPFLFEESGFFDVVDRLAVVGVDLKAVADFSDGILKQYVSRGERVWYGTVGIDIGGEDRLTSV